MSARILSDTKGKIKGLDSDLNPMMVTTANINNYGSEKIKSFIGFNVSFPPSSTLKRIRLGFEIGTPLYEYYHGIQMNENLSINSGLKYDIL